LRRADPAKFGPVGEPLTNQSRTPGAGNASAGDSCLDSLCKRPSRANRTKSVELAPIQTKVVDREIHAVRGEPCRFAAQGRQLCRRVLLLLVLNSGFTGLSLLLLVKAQY